MKTKLFIFALMSITLTGCVSCRYDGKVVEHTEIYGVEHLWDKTYFVPTPKCAERMVASATSGFNKQSYSKFYDCDDIAKEIAQKIRKSYSYHPLLDAQTPAVFTVWLPTHMVIKIVTTDGDRYFDIDGTMIDTPDEINGVIQ